MSKLSKVVEDTKSLLSKNNLAVDAEALTMINNDNRIKAVTDGLTSYLTPFSGGKESQFQAILSNEVFSEVVDSITYVPNQSIENYTREGADKTHTLFYPIVMYYKKKKEIEEAGGWTQDEQIQLTQEMYTRLQELGKNNKRFNNLKIPSLEEQSNRIQNQWAKKTQGVEDTKKEQDVVPVKANNVSTKDLSSAQKTQGVGDTKKEQDVVPVKANNVSTKDLNSVQETQGVGGTKQSKINNLSKSYAPELIESYLNGSAKIENIKKYAIEDTFQNIWDNLTKDTIDPSKAAKLVKELLDHKLIPCDKIGELTLDTQLSLLKLVKSESILKKHKSENKEIKKYVKQSIGDSISNLPSDQKIELMASEQNSKKIFKLLPSEHQAQLYAEINEYITSVEKDGNIMTDIVKKARDNMESVLKKTNAECLKSSKDERNIKKSSQLLDRAKSMLPLLSSNRSSSLSSESSLSSRR